MALLPILNGRSSTQPVTSQHLAISTHTQAISLYLTQSGIDAHCQDLARRSPTPEKRVAAIDAIITFISTQTDPGEQAKPEFAAIRQTLLDHFERAREALLGERTDRLYQALRTQSLPHIAILYTALSRDAFWGLLGRVEQRFDPVAVPALRSWASGWLRQTKERARQASPYPDAMDFNAAGIDATEYLAMTDICRYLGVET